MPFRDEYRRQVQLLIRLLPLVAEEKCFALKGGTAINLFVRDMPRLSVDIDLAYVPVQPRAESLAAIDTAMKRIAARVTKAIPGAHISESRLEPEGIIKQLNVRADGVQTRIEVNPVMRGCVHEPELRQVSQAVEDAFGFAEIPVFAFADLYAGKIVAGLDRQHPRDFFDIRDLLASEGLDAALRRAFIVYMLSHDRPMYAVLQPKLRDISDDYRRGFDGMTEKPVPLEDLLKARDMIIREAVGTMPDVHKRFLISFQCGEANWKLLDIPGVRDLPAVKWRQQKLDALTRDQKAALVSGLEKALSI